MTQTEFEILNKRRGELIVKRSSKFTMEERFRNFDANPGWREEYERRIEEALTLEEKVELEYLQKEVSKFINKKFPRSKLFDSRLKKILKRLRENK